jgi:YfiH family protein
VTDPVWRLEEVDGVRLARCAALETIRGVAHAFSTRLAFGRTDFDLASVENGARTMESRSAVFFRAAGLGEAHPAILRQVHGGVIVNAEARGASPPAADGVIRVARHGAASPVPVVRTADCVAVLLVDRHATAVAALHAGWRGTAAGIGANAVTRFATEGVAPRDLIVALGPAILGCCYEVGADVVAALGAACGEPTGYVARTDSGCLSVDLHAALRRQLVAAGVPTEAIHAAPWCTCCRRDLFFSFRGEGPAAGRLMAAVGPALGP